MEQKGTSSDIVDSWRKELLGYLKEMHDFKSLNDISLILRKLSGFSARASYMHAIAVRSGNKEVSAFRTKEIDPFLKETEFQFRVWSRVNSVYQQEWEMSK